MRLIVGILAVLLVILQYRLWFAEGGIGEAVHLQDRIADEEAQNVELRDRNAVLERQVIDLQSGDAVIEQRAREELGLVKEGEVYYQIIERDAKDNDE